MNLLPLRAAAELAARLDAAIGPEVHATAARIVDDVRREGEAAARRHAERLGDLAPGDPFVVTRPQLRRALERLADADRTRLERIASRIAAFARGQRAALAGFEVAVPGGRAGHRIAPVARAGCYAPGGRHPLPSSVLMTALTARAAGVAEVWVASPRPAPIVLAAAALADADGLLAIGGAQAIAVLAQGAGPVPACDAVVGPGNAYVTAAKQCVSGRVAVDTLAGASELLVLADAEADAALIAADLLAQAEHDPAAVPMLVTTAPDLVVAVERALEAQLADLPTAATARAALANGGVVLVDGLDAAIAACDLLAPEHLALHVADAAAIAPRFADYGALFVGGDAAEVLGDYGAGPNHVLPTGRAARRTGGLSVFTFLRVRTWLAIDDPGGAAGLLEDSAWLARLEGLEAHARAADRRRPR